MTNLKNYLKYYFLEDYLFGEVHKNFKKRGYLTPEEFFAIVIWKSNRAKTGVRNGIKKSGLTVKKITSKLEKLRTADERLVFLDNIPGIGIPIASAILSACYPREFTIADYRACASLKKLGTNIKGNPTSNKSVYFEYVLKCKF